MGSCCHRKWSIRGRKIFLTLTFIYSYLTALRVSISCWPTLSSVDDGNDAAVTNFPNVHKNPSRCWQGSAKRLNSAFFSCRQRNSISPQSCRGFVTLMVVKSELVCRYRRLLTYSQSSLLKYFHRKETSNDGVSRHILFQQ